MKTKITGIEKVMTSLNLELEKIKGMTAAGFIEVAILVRNDMENQVPYIPVDLGNLRASWFAVVTGTQTQYETATFTGVTPSEKKKAAQLTAEYSAMKSSFKEAVNASPMKPSMIMGFTANYAMPVHEKWGATNWSKAGSGPGFFEAAMNRNENKIIRILDNKIKL